MGIETNTWTGMGIMIRIGSVRKTLLMGIWDGSEAQKKIQPKGNKGVCLRSYVLSSSA